MKRTGFKRPKYEDYEFVQPVAKKRGATVLSLESKNSKLAKVHPPTLKRRTGQNLAKSIKRKIKHRSTAKLKKLLDAIFSKYIRAIHPARCYTCGKQEKRERLHCGHFVSRQYLATRWEEDNCRPQCVGCNIFGNGKPLDFEENLIRDIGKKKVEAMKLSRHVIRKLDSIWYENEIKAYKEKLEALDS